MCILIMRLEKLHQADLNLLVTFAVIAEERSITAAAERLRLSQPAISRALQRARETFSDDLLTRSSTGFEATPRGRKILTELEHLLPAMESLLSAGQFDPHRDRSHFRLSAPDNACSILLPQLTRRFVTPRFRTSFEFIPWQPSAADMLEHGQLDMLIAIEDGLLASHLQFEPLYREEFLCVVATESSHREKFTLKRYVAAEHITISTLQGVQSLPDKHVAALGLKRKSSIRLPYFGAALQCLPGTDLVLTITSGMRNIAERDPRLRILDAPKEIVGFHFRMVWHPRLNNDPRHLWLREAIRRTAPKPAAK